MEEQLNKNTLTLEDIIELNEFTQVDDLLTSELSELDDLYSLSKKLLVDEAGINESNKPLRIGSQQANSKRNMMFISNQTANLISLKKLKMDMIKQRSDIKRDMLDRNIKTLIQLDKKGKDDDSELSLKNIATYLINVVNTKPASLQHVSATDAEVDEELEALLLENNEFNETDINTDKDTVCEYIDTSNTESNNKIVYVESEDEYLLVDSNYDTIRTLDIDELNLSEDEDGNIIDLNTKMIIEIVELEGD
jgi:hypothetical protein